ncbi:MAG: radical SAM protein [Cyclobacteriaceae bacterium]|nr:radical SAM protein [Cyclobacteriaceae bacterium]
MPQKVLLITPPFTQLNTPYPATQYLKGFLNTINVESFQADLGIEVILKLFTQEGLTHLFDTIDNENFELSENASRITKLRESYISTIEPVIRFLQNKNATLGFAIGERDFLPEASRFDELEDLEWAFGSLGVQDKAKHIATLYLEDLSDLIKETVDPHFGFSRYAERLSMSATSFDLLYQQVQDEPTYIDNITTSILDGIIKKQKPTLVCISVPFPGNLYGALRCGQFIKSNYPDIKVSMGGGYPNTELRTLKEPRVFELIDFITLDDGERPIQNLLEYLDGDRVKSELKRTFLYDNDQVIYINGSTEPDIAFSQTGTPSYEGLQLDNYLSVIEVTNPMHRLWSDGRWNKLTMAHGCYWKKCTFCDISLDYIKKYEPVGASLLCDKMEELIRATGETGFHFVDEAAPPALMRDLALEIIKRNLTVTWWTNIRFEQRFTPDLCQLLKASGCIAVSGGLEVASDRLLEKMQKGVTVQQVARVADNFTQSGIMVHAYLMYGFPTQTVQETVDSLEMVRQLFEQGVIQSGFWHLFAMTAHSPVGLNPKAFGVEKIGPQKGAFANNDLMHKDREGAKHTKFGEGLRKALFNYMHGICFEFDLQEWFAFDIPITTVTPNFIEEALATNPGTLVNANSKLVWVGNMPIFSKYEKQKKGKRTERARLTFETRNATTIITFPIAEGKWLYDIFSQIIASSKKPLTLTQFQQSYIDAGLGVYEQFANSQPWAELRKEGLLLV